MLCIYSRILSDLLFLSLVCPLPLLYGTYLFAKTRLITFSCALITGIQPSRGTFHNIPDVNRTLYFVLRRENHRTQLRGVTILSELENHAQSNSHTMLFPSLTKYYTTRIYCIYIYMWQFFYVLS